MRLVFAGSLLSLTNDDISVIARPPSGHRARTRTRSTTRLAGSRRAGPGGERPMRDRDSGEIETLLESRAGLPPDRFRARQSVHEHATRPIFADARAVRVEHYREWRGGIASEAKILYLSKGGYHGPNCWWRKPGVRTTRDARILTRMFTLLSGGRLKKDIHMGISDHAARGPDSTFSTH